MRQSSSATAHEQTLTCACTSIRRASRALTQVYDKALAPTDLSVTQYAILAKLTRLGPVNLGALAAEMGMDRTTISRTLRPLRSRGLLADAVGFDRRQRVVAVTAAGTEAVERARPLWRDAQARVATAFGPERLANLLNELAAVESVAP